VGAWILLGFGLFSTVSFADALAHRRLLGDGVFTRAFHVVGAAFGLSLAGYNAIISLGAAAIGLILLARSRSVA